MADNFNHDENAWLITLPATDINGGSVSERKILALRTINDRYYAEDDSIYTPRLLTQSQCTLTLSWLQSGSKGAPVITETFIATCKIDPWNNTVSLDLTNENFELAEKDLRGQGLGSWIMQQLIRWARTFPATVPVNKITVSEVDETDPHNKVRRDHLWAGIGFRFAENAIESQPLCVGELQMPESRHSCLNIIPVKEGVAMLVSQSEKQDMEIKRLVSIKNEQAKNIREFNNSAKDIQCINAIGSVLGYCFRFFFWLYEKMLRRGKKEGSLK